MTSKVLGGFTIAKVCKESEVEFARRGRSSKYAELAEGIKKLKIGETALIDVPAKADKNAFRFNVGSACRRIAQPAMAGALITRLTKDGKQVAICHMPKPGEKAKHSPRAKAASAKPKASKKSKPKAKPAPAAVPAVPAVQPTFNPAAQS